MPPTFSRVISIDPGHTKSAFVIFDPNFPDRPVRECGILENDALLTYLKDFAKGDVLVIEMVESFGMAVGKEVFETVFWIGRFWQAFRGPRRERLFRKGVKIHLCQTTRASDTNIRAVLMDRFGPGQDKAVGIKKRQGPLYGLKKDMWSALALALTFCEINGAQEKKPTGTT